jgi:large subunit ribosomal protein L3
MLFTLLGKKIGMTQVYDKESSLVPVTVVEVGPCSVVQVKTTESDGYNAIQIGFGKAKVTNVTQQLSGHYKKAGVAPHTSLKEVRCTQAPTQKVGDVLDVNGFTEGQMVDVIGITKGKGFQGVMKRYRMAGQPATHGHMMHRRPGSIGCRQTPGHVNKGKHMPGHMGVDQRTVQNLKVIKLIPEKNIMLVKGSIPGANGEQVIVRSSKKSTKNS